MYYENFKDLCELYKARPADITKATGITSSTFTNWKKGVYTPKQEKLMLIADFFGVPLGVLTGADETSHEIIRDNHQSQQLVDDFLKLDLDDRRTVLLLISSMLEKDKYKKGSTEVGEVG